MPSYGELAVLVAEQAAQLAEQAVLIEGLRVELTEVGTAAHGPPHEPGVLERLDVLGSGGQRHPERLGQLAHRVLLRGQPAKHRPPGRVGQRAEHAVEMP